MKYELPEGIEVEVVDGSGRLTSELKASCPYCHTVDCDWDCDLSQEAFSDAKDSLEREELNEDHCRRLQWNAAIDGVESLILALVCAGVPVDDKFKVAVQTALDAIANNYDVEFAEGD